THIRRTRTGRSLKQHGIELQKETYLLIMGQYGIPYCLFISWPKGSFLFIDQTTLQKYETIRSEEHTSELQSRFDLVCRLLLEKTKHTDEEAADSTVEKVL